LWIGNLIRGKRRRYAPERSRQERMENTKSKRKEVSLQLSRRIDEWACQRKWWYAGISGREVWQGERGEKNVERNAVKRERG
jgi:hypothetical protein